MSNSSEWNLSTGPRIVDPSREPVFDITADGKIVEVNDAPHGENRPLRSASAQRKIGNFSLFFVCRIGVCGVCMACVMLTNDLVELKKSQSFFKKKKGVSFAPVSLSTAALTLARTLALSHAHAP
jgi:hypothetical protein